MSLPIINDKASPLTGFRVLCESTGSSALSDYLDVTMSSPKVYLCMHDSVDGHSSISLTVATTRKLIEALTQLVGE